MGRCPFHEERTPSFSVNGVDKLYYCFGCGAKGDLITFVRETEGLDFAGAIEWLGERFRVPLEYEESSPAQDAARKRRERLFALLDQAATFYERTLWDSEAGGMARDYLKGRGLAEDACRAFRLGLALGGDTLARKALREGLHARGAARRGTDAAARRRLLLAPPPLPARRCARAGTRLPGAPSLRRRPAEGEVREHPRIGALPQGLGRLRARQGAGRDRAGGSRVHRRGQHRRDRPAPGGARAGGREHGHGADRGTAEGAGTAEQAALACVRR